MGSVSQSPREVGIPPRGSASLRNAREEQGALQPLRAIALLLAGLIAPGTVAVRSVIECALLSSSLRSSANKTGGGPGCGWIPQTSMVRKREEDQKCHKKDD